MQPSVRYGVCVLVLAVSRIFAQSTLPPGTIDGATDPKSIPDYGEYTAVDEPDVTCSELGNIVDTKIYLYLSWGITFSSTVGWPCDGPDCVQQPACSGGTVASCPLSVYYNTGGPCYLYVVTYGPGYCQ